MRHIPPATVIVLTVEERRALEGLPVRARARGASRASRASCFWPRLARCRRVRYGRDRLSGLSETGNRGAERKYGPEHGRRILALLDKPPLAGTPTGRAVAGTGACGHPRAVYLAVPPCPEDRPVGAEIVVSEHRCPVRCCLATGEPAADKGFRPISGGVDLN
jgi:hypothetical protein